MSRRALIVAHGHPDFSKGGAEIAAQLLHRELNATPGWESQFMACSQLSGLRHTGTPFGQRPDARELLFSGSTDSFQFAAREPRDLWSDFAAYLRRFQPDVVHLHHYVNLGVEAIRVVRNTLPGVPIILTLHEYLAICNQNGQMLKSGGGLCYQSSPAECHACLPGSSPQDYLLRELYIKSFFKLVDRFVAPSEFLRQRYIAWGLAPERIVQLENLLAAPTPAAAPAASPAGPLRLAYFGQITPFKGVEVAVEAYASLPAALRRQASLEIHGGGEQVFDAAFRERIARLFAEAPKGVRRMGSYSAADLPARLRDVDCVILPSIWWENSPLVIQEAFLHGKPVICAGIGGMAEKVRDGIDGLHFRVGSAVDLAVQLRRLIEDRKLLDQLRSGVRAPRTGAGALRPFLDLYEQLMAVPATPTP